MQDAVIWGAFDGNNPVWPPESPSGLFVPASVMTRHRGGGGVRDPLTVARETYEPMRRGMNAAADIEKAIEAARKDAGKLVLERQGFSQSIDSCALEADNGNAWYDAETRTLHLVASAQSPYEVVRVAALMVKDNKRFPVKTIKLLTGTTVGYGAKDHSIFPFYVIAACFYGNGLPVRLANNRYEQFQLGIKRHSVEMDVTIVADRKSGKFEILKASIISWRRPRQFLLLGRAGGRHRRAVHLLFSEIRSCGHRTGIARGGGGVHARLRHPSGHEHHGADGR